LHLFFPAADDYEAEPPPIIFFPFESVFVYFVKIEDDVTFFDS
jgi:hypothetical protein